MFIRFAWACVTPPGPVLAPRLQRALGPVARVSPSFCRPGRQRYSATCRVRREQVRRDAHTGGVRYLKEGTPERPGIKLVTAARARQLLKSWVLHRNRT